MSISTNLPDVSKERLHSFKYPLERVGMSRLEIPVKVEIDKDSFYLKCRVDSFINLNKEDIKGIHMSRIYDSIQGLKRGLYFTNLISILKKMIETQKELCDKSYLHLSLDLPLRQNSLKSNKSFFHFYPLSLHLNYEQKSLSMTKKTRLYYSSTCPCSMALSQKLLQNRFLKDFDLQNNVPKEEVIQWLGQEGNAPTPHSQRSYADILWKEKDHNKDILESLEDMVSLGERSLQTSVQVYAKREDEQAFSELNSKNPMFCEDALRRLKESLERKKDILDYKIKVCHMESLHPYNAVSLSVKGLEGGFKL